MEFTRYGASCVVLSGTGSLPGYGSTPWVWVVCTPCAGSSVTLSAILGKVVGHLRERETSA